MLSLTAATATPMPAVGESPAVANVVIIATVASIAVLATASLMYGAWRRWGPRNERWIWVQFALIILTAAVAAGTAALEGETTLALTLTIAGVVLTAVWAMPRLLAELSWRPAASQRLRFLHLHLSSLADELDALPPIWDAREDVDFAIIDQPAAVRPYERHTPAHTDSPTLGDIYDPKGAAARRIDAATAVLDAQHHLILVIGEPGYGKTWLLRGVARRYVAAARKVTARRWPKSRNEESILVPVWLRLDALANDLSVDSAAPGETITQSFTRAITSRSPTCTTSGYREWLTDRISANECVLLLDGLDEVPVHHFDRLRDALRAWTSAQQLIHNVMPRVVVASRPTENADRIFDSPATILELLPFDRSAVRRFVTACISDTTQQREVLHQLTDPATAGIARVPLLLTLLCRLAVPPNEDNHRQLPTRRSALYEQVLEDFIRIRDIDDRRGLETPAIWRLLQHIALAMATDRSGWTDLIGHDAVLAIIGRQFDGRNSPSARQILSQLTARGRGILITTGDALRPNDRTTYRFLHRTFHEYLVARALTRHPDRNRLIEKHRWFDDNWRQVLIMLAGQPMTSAPYAFSPEQYVKGLADTQGDPLFHSLFLAAVAAAELPNADSSAVVSGIVAKVIERIESPAGVFGADAAEMLRPLCDTGHATAVSEVTRLIREDANARVAAINALGPPRTREAVVTLLSCLDDDNHIVQLRAQTSLAGTADADLAIEVVSLLEEPAARRVAASLLRGRDDPYTIGTLVDRLSNDDPGTRLAAVWALAGTSHPKAIDAIVGRLADNDPQMRLAAIDALRDIDDPRAYSALVSCLAEHDRYTRLAAASALEGTNEPDVIAELVSRLADDDADSQLAVVWALAGTSNPKAIDALVRRVADEDHELRLVATWALRRAGGPEATRALVGCLTDSKPEVRVAAASVLRGTDDPDAIGALVSHLSDRDRNVRQAVVDALRGTDDPTAVADLIHRLNDDDPEARLPAVWALAGTSDPKAVDALVGRLADEDHEVRLAAAWALEGTKSPEAISVLADRLRCADPEVRLASAWAMRNTGHPEAIAVLVGCLSDQDGQVRQAAVDALKETDHPAAVAALVDRLAHEDWQVRLVAVRALEATGHPEAIAVLVGCLSDQDWQVRQAAVDALKETDHPAAIVGLAGHAFFGCLPREDQDGPLAAAWALEGNGHTEVVGALIARLHHEDWQVRRVAAWALKGTRRSEAIVALDARLADERGEVRLAAAWALEGNDHPDVVEALIARLDHERPEVRLAAVRALRSTDDGEAIAALVTLLGDDEPAVRDAVVDTMRVSQHPEMVVAHLAHGNVEAKLAAASALQGTQHPDAIIALIACRDGAYDLRLRRIASLALLATASRTVAVALGTDRHIGADVVRETDDSVNVNAPSAAVVSQARITSQSDTIAVIIGRLDDADIAVRSEAARALARATDVNSVFDPLGVVRKLTDVEAPDAAQALKRFAPIVMQRHSNSTAVRHEIAAICLELEGRR